MLGALLRGAKMLVGGKYQWKTILTGLAAFNLLKPKGRMNPAYQQMSMYQGMNPGMGMNSGAGMTPGGTPGVY